MPTILDPSILGKLPLFQNIPSEQLVQLSAALHRKTFAAATTLITAEQPGEVAFIILKGTVKVHVEQADGSDVILAILGVGELVGELSMIDNPSRSATVVTLEESVLLWIDRVAFQQWLQTMPALTYNLVRVLARRLRLANAQIQSLATQDVFGRVAHLLLAFAQEYGEPGTNADVLIPLRLTQSDLASLVGASRVRVNQVLGFYKQRNYISINHTYYITVHDQEALARRSQ